MLSPRRVDRAKLKALRLDRGLSHRALAQLIQDRTGQAASWTYLCKIERSHPSAENVSDLYLGRIAAALGVPVDVFSTRDDGPVAA